MSTSPRGGSEGTSGGEGRRTTPQHPQCEQETTPQPALKTQKKELPLSSGLKMSDSPKPWYWRGGFSSPAPSPAPSPRSQDDAAERTPSHTREESEALLEQLDEQWFCDNVVRWPSSRPGSPPGIIDKHISSPFYLPDPTASAVAKPRHLNPPRSRPEVRRLSDGDHHLRRYLERDQIHRLANSSSVPTSTDQPRYSPLAPPGPLMGVTEDEEMENDLFAKMLANRPAKLTTINPGRSARNPLQENQISSAEIPARKPQQLRQRRRLKGTKSLTDLEYEELRGLKDLGFEVSKDDLTPHVVRMFPGLQRQGIPPYNSSSQGENQSVGPSFGRENVKVKVPQHLPWPRRPDSPLLNAPALDPSIDMKGQLKSWASEMASIVSIEC